MNKKGRKRYLLITILCIFCVVIQISGTLACGKVDFKPTVSHVMGNSFSAGLTRLSLSNVDVLAMAPEVSQAPVNTSVGSNSNTIKAFITIFIAMMGVGLMVGAGVWAIKALRKKKEDEMHM